MSPSVSSPGWWRGPVVLAAGFGLAAAALLLFYRAHPLLYDADAYYHLAVARDIAAHGIPDRIPGLRLSLLADGFGDKELLFHLLLVPFARLADAEAGGRIALAILDALILTLLAGLGRRALGVWGLLLPLGLLLGSLETSWRLVRLRPELLSFVLLLLALAAIGSRRDRWLLPLGALYALAYTGFHALLGLCALLFLWRGWRRRDWRPGLILYPLVGCAVGLLLHPDAAANLRVWWAQNVTMFRLGAEIDTGGEMSPQPVLGILALNLGLILALLALVRSARAPADGEPDPLPADDGWADAFGFAAGAFLLLYARMSRFALYAFPLAALWALFELRRRGLRPSARVAVGRFGAPLWLALAVALAFELPEAGRQLQTFARRTTPGPHGERVADRLAFGRAVPDGAKVAAPWRSTPIYLFFAPQGRYLNALHPVFLAAKDRAAADAERRIFSGDEPDVPLTAATTLDSDYLAFSTASESPILLRRLETDPRVEILYRGIQLLARLVPDRNQRFLRDWRAGPDTTDAGRLNREEVAGWTAGAGSPAAVPEGRAAAYAGFVALPGDGCATVARASGFVHVQRLELASYGPARAWLEGRPVAEVPQPGLAVLGLGVTFEAPAGESLLVVRSCPGPGGRNGFYLVSRDPPPAP